MEHEFWHARWHSNQIGFHEATTHPLLLQHWHSLNLAAGARVFVPLCGKSLDLRWLRACGHEVVGAELSAIAIEAFFAEAGLVPTHRVCSGFIEYTAPGYTLYCGDYFALDRALLGPIAAVYDRAAMIALPPAMRRDYAATLSRLCTSGTRMLLVTVEYDISALSPPPFPVHAAEIADHYSAEWIIEDRGRTNTTVKGQPGTELAFTLTRC